MSLFRRTLGLDPGGHPAGAPAVGDTDSVRRIAARLAALPPERARFTAAFAYLLARTANVNASSTEVEAAEMTRLVAEVGELTPETARLVVDLASTRAERFGATDDYLVTREFRSISTPADRIRLLRCCLLVAAADDVVDADEAWLVNRLAEELDVDRADLNGIRAEFEDRMAGVRELRRLREEAAANPVAAPPPPKLSGELPDGVTVEQVYLVEVPYTPEASERRPGFRREHLARIARLMREGRIIESGGTLDFGKAVLIVRAADADEALAMIAEDVYTTGGVWHSPTVAPWGRVVLEGRSRR
jgi:uncharacterized protein YciI/uncharacterized tellurite resistance protein B-like protein